MAARFTENQGDPAWLKSQREAQNRVVPARVHRAMPYPTATPPVRQTQASATEFKSAASAAGNVAFVLGFMAVSHALRRRR